MLLFVINTVCAYLRHRSPVQDELGRHFLRRYHLDPFQHILPYLDFLQLEPLVGKDFPFLVKSLGLIAETVDSQIARLQQTHGRIDTDEAIPSLFVQHRPHPKPIGNHTQFRFIIGIPSKRNLVGIFHIDDTDHGTQATIPGRNEILPQYTEFRTSVQLVRRFLPFLAAVFGANLLLTVMRDIKEDFIVRIIDVSTITSWTFAQTDTLATVLMLAIFALLAGVRNHLRVLCTLLGLSVAGMFALSFIGARCDELQIPVVEWLFLQTFLIDIAYLSFQTIFFERFIACFRIAGNVGFFIITIDFVGYVGTLGLLGFKELAHADMDWTTFYNGLNFYVGLACGLAFLFSIGYLLVKAPRKSRCGAASAEPEPAYLTPQTL